MELKRINKGEYENAEGYFLKGIMVGERWVYENPFMPARLYDDEIAIAACLQKMAIMLLVVPNSMVFLKRLRITISEC